MHARAGLLLLTALACGPPEPHPAVDPPINGCGTCEEGSCNAKGFCQVEQADDDVDFVLVLPMPDSVYYAPNLTYLFTRNELADAVGKTKGCGNCVTIPRLGSRVGRYLVDQDAAHRLGASLPLDNDVEVGQAQVPMNAVYRRMIDLDGNFVEATSVGLPVPPDFGRRSLDASPFALGIGGSSAITSTVNLPPGTYRVDFDVDPALRALLPPRVEPYVIPVSTQTIARLDTFQLAGAELDAPSVRTTTIQSEYRSLDGFRAYLFDKALGRVVSRSVLLKGNKVENVYLATKNQLGPNGLPATVELVIEPPPEAFAPTLRTPVLSGLLAPDYPEIPQPSILVGEVRGPRGEGVAARVHIVSAGLLSLRSGVAEEQLRYATALATDANGRFSTVVPEGTYKVFVDPDAALSVARSVITLRTAGVESGVSSGTRTTWTVPVVPKTRVTGRAVLADNTVLEDVAVKFAPALSRVADSAYELPRPLSTRTDADGRFAVEVDAGSYDLTVTPISGTRFAPYVLTDQIVPSRAYGGCTLALGDLHVKIPRVLSLALRDPRTEVIPWVWARVFARSAGSQHYVEIQKELLDADGTADLLFRKPEHATPKECTP